MRDRPLSISAPWGVPLPDLQRALWCLVPLLLFFATAAPGHGTVLLTGTTYTQDFNGLPGGQVTWVNNSTLPGWYVYKQPLPAEPFTGRLIYDLGNRPETGLTNIGSNLSDRALGSASTNSVWNNAGDGVVAGWIVVGITNQTGHDISSADVRYRGEQWRVTPSEDYIAAAWMIGEAFDASELTSAGEDFTFRGRRSTLTTDLVDGELPINSRSDIGGELTLDWEVGETLWIAFLETNVPDVDHRLAVDDFKITATFAAPEPGAPLLLTIALSAACLWRRRGR